MNQKPEFLKQGSKIAIISPSGSINNDFIFSAKKYLDSMGFDAVVYPNALNKYFQFGGTDDERLEDLQNSLDDPSVSAIFCSRGGYGLIRIIDKLDFTEFIRHPKWIIGFSDITNLHLALNRIGVMSVHGQMAKAIHDNKKSDSVENLVELLVGKFPVYKCEPNSLNKKGNAEAELIGGNLSIIYSLQGTDFELDSDGKILFMEDLNEYLYHLDRIMINLKLSGKLKNLKGLIAGAFTDMKDNNNPFGKDAYEIIKEHISEYDYPVCFGFPSGHIQENMPLVMGMRYNLVVNDENTVIFPSV
ncbi:MAG: LD-carboxypeptidase [Bacteroidales bacterium]|jgi:muramoyltetrapeptide carboxypeptidase|nr:LD-carboxypeptidase [Bacteroidales bacterium]